MCSPTSTLPARVPPPAVSFMGNRITCTSSSRGTRSWLNDCLRMPTQRSPTIEAGRTSECHQPQFLRLCSCLLGIICSLTFFQAAPPSVASGQLRLLCDLGLVVRCDTDCQFRHELATRKVHQGSPYHFAALGRCCLESRPSGRIQVSPTGLS